MKIGKKKPSDLALLLRTSTREQMKRVGKLIGASVMRAKNRPNTMTRNPKEQIIELNKLMCGNLRISTPTNGSTSNKRHNVINERNLYVRVHRLLYQRYTKSKSHYLTGNDKLFTPYPSLHIVKVGIIIMDKEV